MAEKDRACREPRTKTRYELTVVGWKEWAALPDIGVKRIQAKFDTGARTSALHASRMALVQKNGVTWVNFSLDSDESAPDGSLPHIALLKDVRDIKSSSGHVERRYLIETTLKIATMAWRIDVSLTDRSDMNVPFLIGRSAMAQRIVVNPARTFLAGGKRPKATTDDEEE